MNASAGKFVSVFLLSLALTGCHGAGTTIQSSSSDEAGKSASWAYIENGAGRFECRKSATGSCHYVLYVQQCAPEAPLAGCSARVVRSFTLAAGQSRVVARLPRQVRLCQDQSAMPVAPDCAR